jgi:CHAD domain-containing protein
MQRIPPPQKWIRPPLRATARIGDAFIANVGATAAQIRANRPGVAAGRDPEYLHQLRVGIRRLRSMLRACRRLVRGAEAERLDRRLRAALDAFGAARDWDVFEASCTQPVLRRRVRARALAARRGARTMARSAQFRFMPDAALAWARGRPWRKRANAGEPLAAFAPRALERLHRRAAEAAEGIDWQDAAQRHRLRIRVKRLRYATESLAAAWPEPAMAPFLKKLRGLQEILGELNDIEVQRRLLAEAAGVAKLRAADAWRRSLVKRERALIEKLRRAWRRFDALTPVWRGPAAAPVAE